MVELSLIHLFWDFFPFHNHQFYFFSSVFSQYFPLFFYLSVFILDNTLFVNNNSPFDFMLCSQNEFK